MAGSCRARWIRGPLSSPALRRYAQARGSGTDLYQRAADSAHGEPFSALDVQTRNLMGGELLQLWSTSSASVVFVTHDLEEAIALADRVIVLTAGPATVKGIYTVDLPRPRNVAEIRFDPHFIDLYHDIWEDLRNEVMISYERAKQRG